MADQEQLEIIAEDGVAAWNVWRTENPRVLTDLSGAELKACYLYSANFEGTNLQQAVLQGCILVGANLTGANLTGAKLAHADLTQSDLTGANLRDTDLTSAKFNDAHLIDANFRGAKIENASFKRAEFNPRTLGLLGRLPVEQRAAMTEVELEAIPEDTPQETTQQVPDNSDNLTVGYAKSILGPAHEVLIGLTIPNDLSEAHRDLFLELLRTVEDLQRRLAGLREENRRLSDESEELRKTLDAALPLWKRAWETFVLKGAEVAGGGAVFTAGFIAGATYSAFTAEAPGIPI